MKIAFVVTHYDPKMLGGAQVHVRDLSAALARQGHTVTVMAGGSDELAGELSGLGASYHRLYHLVRSIHPVKDLLAVSEIRAAIRRVQPDLVATHSSKAGWLGRLAARSLGLPCVFTAHGWAFTEGVPQLHRRLYQSAERLVSPLANRIITVSHFDRELALRCRIAKPQRLITVYNGVADVPEHLWADCTQDPCRLIMVARFQEQKDHWTLIRALSQLRNLSWTLDLVGDGPLRDGTEQQAMGDGLGERVRFLGVRHDVSGLLAKADAFVLASKWEGFPLTILEAMRARLPVVASDVGGVGEAVVEGVTGYLVPREDAGTLSDRLRRLIVDCGLRKRMGEAGRVRYEVNFTLDRMVLKTLSVYEDVLRNTRDR